MSLENVFAYPDPVWRRFAAPRWVGRAANETAIVTMAGRSEETRLSLSARVEGARIVELRWRALGCPFLIAAAEHLAERVNGAPVQALAEVRSHDWISALEMPIEKAHCALLLEDGARALLSALTAAEGSPP
jgi:NifU-like protein involved in Fe-S cluster formation